MPKPFWKRRGFWILAGLAFFVGFFSFKLGLAYNTIVINKDDNGPWWGRVASILPFGENNPEATPDPNPVPKPEPDRLDILILGIRGEDDLENGGLLADSIQVLSIDKKTKKTSVISLPRDLYLEDVGGITGKLNEIYSRGLARRSGFSLPKEEISRITGVYVDKIVVVDFGGFLGIVDTLGGIKVYLDKEFKEPEQWGYEFHLPEGENHLDGQRALYFVRSRYSTSDFDRSRRQQIVILAIKDNILSLGTLLNPLKVSGLISQFKDNVRTDFNAADLPDLIDLSKAISNDTPATYVISTDNLLYQEVGENLYRLRPKAGDFTEIKTLFKGILNDQ